MRVNREDRLANFDGSFGRFHRFGSNNDFGIRTCNNFDEFGVKSNCKRN